jgi:DNA-directed RNA polymerase subunit M/transcription elongation factor TFIIS
MQRNNRSAIVDGNGQASEVVALPPNAVANRERGSADAWQSRISNDRPVYDCPKCSESAMQFYGRHQSHFDQTDFFRCHACGTNWEM